jgi:hypothetical protein
MEHMRQPKSLKQPRREYLRAYLLACVRDNVLTLADLTSGDAITKLLNTVSTDARQVIGDMIRDGVSTGVGMLGAFLASRVTKR